MSQSFNHLRYPLAALALVVISACGRAPEATGPAPAAAKVNVAKVLEQPINEWDEFTGRLMSGQPNAGVGFELDAIAAVVLGGTAIAGGRGLILGTLIGAVLLGILNNGLNLVGINPYMQDVIKGLIILLAIYIGREWR